MVEKYWFYWCFEWFWYWIFGDLLDEILWIECDFWLSSIEALIYKSLMGFWGGMWWFLMVWKVVKCLILLSLLEVCIEVVFGLVWGEMSRKRWFYKEFVDRTDVPGLQSNTCSKNVNLAPYLHFSTLKY